MQTILTRALFCLVLLVAHTGRAGVRAELDRSEASLGDTVTLSVRVEGSADGEPQLPPLPDFDVGSRSQSSQIQLVNGSLFRGTTYSYGLSPRREGTLTVGPIAVTLDGRRELTQPLSLRVAKPSATTPGSDFFVTAETTTTTPFVGEQVVYVLKLYARGSASCPTLAWPDIPGLVAESLDTQRRYETTVGGKGYVVLETRRAYFAERAGTLVLPGASLTCDIEAPEPARRRRSVFDDPFFGGRRHTVSKTLRADEVSLAVRPLPPSPPDFSGLVGTVSVQAEMSRSAAATGESVALALTVSGDANLAVAPEPTVVGLAGMKSYDERPGFEVKRDGDRVEGTRRFTKALVPAHPGSYTLRASLRVFDPAAQAYVVVESPRLALVVDGTPLAGALPPTLASPSPPAASTNPAARPSSTAGAGSTAPDTQAPLVASVTTLTAGPLARAPSRSALAWALVLPALSGWALTKARRWRGSAGTDAAARDAWRTLDREARALVGASTSAAASSAAVARLLRRAGQLADPEHRLAADARELEAGLARAGCALEVQRAGGRLLEQCEALSYGAQGTGARVADLGTEVQSFVAVLEACHRERASRSGR